MNSTKGIGIIRQRLTGSNNVLNNKMWRIRRIRIILVKYVWDFPRGSA